MIDYTWKVFLFPALNPPALLIVLALSPVEPALRLDNWAVFTFNPPPFLFPRPCECAVSLSTNLKTKSMKRDE